jgi:hypothetical protein
MPIAGRVSRPLGVGVVVGGVERGRVVCGTVVCAGADVLADAEVVTGGEGLIVVAGAGVVTMGCGVAIGGAGGGAGGAGATIAGGGVVGSADVDSTLVGVSSD